MSLIDFSYGKGVYLEGEKRLEGTIILGEHKLYLKDENGDLAQTYIPLEKIERIEKIGGGMKVFVRPSLYFRYTALFQGEKKYVKDLVKDIVSRRGLKKKFLKNEWTESDL